MMTSLKEWLLRLSDLKSPIEEKGIRVSLLGMCPLRHYFTAIGEPENYTDESLLIFARGYVIEDLVRQYYTKIYPHKTRRNVPLEYEFGIAHCDIMFFEKREIIEVKSCDDFARPPFEHHRLQLNMYLHLVRKKKEEPWTGKLSYVKLPSFEVEEFTVNYDEGLALKSYEELRFINECVKQKKAPVEKAHWNTWECYYVTRRGNEFYCPFYAKCSGLFERPLQKEEIKKAVRKEGVDALVEVEERLKELRKQERELEAKRDELKEDLFSDTDVVESDNFRVELIKVVSERLDTKRLKFELPDIYNKFKLESSYTKIKIVKK